MLSKTTGKIYGQTFDTTYKALAIVLAAMCAGDEYCPLALCMDFAPLCTQ